jgi:hypothetical protein
VYNGTGLSLGDEALVTADAPIRGLDVQYAGDRMTVHADGCSGSVSLATLGAKRAVVNGKPVDVPDNADRLSLP